MAPSSASKAAPAQPKQPSRKGKKAWRKNVDITPVTSGLETLREEIIQHGRPLGEVAQDELFALDTVGSSKEDVSRTAGGKKIKVLKMDQILGKRSAVPALESRGKRTLPDDRVGDGLVAAKRQKIDWVSKKEVARLRNNLEKKSHLDVENIDSSDIPNGDLWGDATTTSIQPTSSSTLQPSQKQNDEYIPQPRAKVAPSTLKRPPISLTRSGQPTSAVPTPSAAHSYNPTFEDWDAQLTEQGEKELQAETLRLAAQKREAERQARIDHLAAQPERAPGDEVESEWEGFETEPETEDLSKAEMNRRKRPERKTPAQRNKLKRRKEAERAAKHEARMSERQKRNEEMVKALLVRQAKEEDEEQQPSPDPAQHLQDDDLSLRRKPTLGPSRATIPEQPLELVLPDELQDSLRRLKPEGNLLTDRFRNLLVNGKLEARRRVTYAASRKRQVKMTEKWWSKDFQIGA